MNTKQFSADSIIDVGGIRVRMIDTPSKPRPTSKPRERNPNECKGSRVALAGSPMGPCPWCGREFERLNMLVGGGDVRFPPHKPPSTTEKRQAAAARARAERERRIAADRVNSTRAAAAFAQWCSPTQRKERVSAQDAAYDNGCTTDGSSSDQGTNK